MRYLVSFLFIFSIFYFLFLFFFHFLCETCLTYNAYRLELVVNLMIGNAKFQHFEACCIKMLVNPSSPALCILSIGVDSQDNDSIPIRANWVNPTHNT